MRDATAGAVTRLVCLPFAGSGAGFYRAWKKLPVEGIEVIPLQLPGREERFIDEPPTSVLEVAAELARDVRDLPAESGPLALFGHSLGAILAFETARELMRSGNARVGHLFVSGSPGPWTPRASRATGLPDDEFLSRVNEFAGYRHEAFDDPDMRELLLPLLRSDVAMHEGYEPVSAELLSIPVTSIRGADDQLVPAPEALRWQDITTGPFRAVEFPGSHMYLTQSAEPLLGWLRAATGEPAVGR